MDGSSKYLICTNYLDSASRRKSKSVDHGSHTTVQFSKIKCKKDECEIQCKMSPIVNNGIKKLESSMLISILFDKEKVKCEFIPYDWNDIKSRERQC